MFDGFRPSSSVFRLSLIEPDEQLRTGQQKQVDERKEEPENRADAKSKTGPYPKTDTKEDQNCGSIGKAPAYKHGDRGDDGGEEW